MTKAVNIVIATTFRLKFVRINRYHRWRALGNRDMPNKKGMRDSNFIVITSLVLTKRNTF